MWSGELPPQRGTGLSVLGIAVSPHSHLVVEQFAIQGKPQPAVINHLFIEAILGTGGSGNDWKELRGPEFHYGLAARSNDSPHAVALTATDGLLVVDSIEATR
jgi:hypothetical protein